MVALGNFDSGVFSLLSTMDRTVNLHWYHNKWHLGKGSVDRLAEPDEKFQQRFNLFNSIFQFACWYLAIQFYRMDGDPKLCGYELLPLSFDTNQICAFCKDHYKGKVEWLQCNICEQWFHKRGFLKQFYVRYMSLEYKYVVFDFKAFPHLWILIALLIYDLPYTPVSLHHSNTLFDKKIILKIDLSEKVAWNSIFPVKKSLSQWDFLQSKFPSVFRNFWEAFPTTKSLHVWAIELAQLDDFQLK